MPSVEWCSGRKDVAAVSLLFLSRAAAAAAGLSLEAEKNPR